MLRRLALFGALSCFVANGLKGVFKLPRPPRSLHVGVGGRPKLTRTPRGLRWVRTGYGYV